MCLCRLSLFLSLISLLTLSASLNAHQKTILATVTHKSTDLRHNAPCDASIQFTSQAEQCRVRAAFESPKTRTEAAHLKNEFVTKFLQITNQWTREAAKSATQITIKTLTVHNSTNQVMLAIRFVFTKELQSNNIAITITIMSDATTVPVYVENLVKAAFSDKNSSSKSALCAVAVGSVILLCCAFLPKNQTQRREPLHFFAQCTQRLEKISERIPHGTLTLTKASTSPTSLRFSTTTMEDQNRGWSRTLNFELREARRDDKHSSMYVLYDNKYGKKNKLIYEINTVDDFTTAMLTHLLVRKVDIGPVLEYFEGQISGCVFKDTNVMTQFYQHNTAAGTLQEALDIYKATRSLAAFFANHHN